MIISFGSYFLVYIVYMNYFDNEVYESFTTQITTIRIWFVQFMLCFLILVGDLFGKTIDKLRKKRRY